MAKMYPSPDEKEKSDMMGLPMFDSTNVVTWSKRLKMWLMRKRRNPLGLENRPEQPPNNAAAAVRQENKEELTVWLERKDTCVSAVYESVQAVPEVLEIVDQYILEKEILDADDPKKEVLAKDLVSRLVNRFRGEVQI